MVVYAQSQTAFDLLIYVTVATVFALVLVLLFFAFVAQLDVCFVFTPYSKASSSVLLCTIDTYSPISCKAKTT